MRNRRFHRFNLALVTLLTVALVGGMVPANVMSAAAAPTPGSASGMTYDKDTGNFTVTLDLGITYDPVVMAKIIADPLTHAALSANIIRWLNQKVPNEVAPGTVHPEDMSPSNVAANFDGKISELPNHTGLVAQANLTSNATEVELKAAGSLLIAYAFSNLLRAYCAARLDPTGAPLGRVAAAGCATVGAVSGTFVNGFIFLGFQNDLTNGAAWANIALPMLESGLNAALWDGGMGDFLRSLYPPSFIALGVALFRIGSDLMGITQYSTNVFAYAGAFFGNGAFANSIASSLPVSLPPQSGASPPCDLDSAAGDPCVSANSTTRALSLYYDGPLYQIQRASDSTTTDVGVLAPGGVANAAKQDSFCAGTTCIISKIYDQSFNWNDLTVEGAGGNGGADHAANASALPITIGGHKVYGLAVTGEVGYRDNSATGTATAGMPESMYMVASGTYVNSGCCFDYGNAEVSTTDTGNGHMDAVNLGTECYFGSCSGSGPWVEADLENGLFSGGNGPNFANKGNNSNFVTAMLKNDGQTTYALKGGNSQSGGLSTWWDGSLPTDRAGYKPMQQEGAILLGTGGDNSNSSIGSFFEGVMTAGYPSTATDDAVEANIVSAGYGGSSAPAPDASSGTASAAAGAAVVHDGYSSVYTVDAANNNLQESYLKAMGQAWKTQDLFGTPTVAPGTTPVALVHGPITSVITVDATNGHIQETFLTAIGDTWQTQDLTAIAGAPATRVTPTVVLHDGYVSIYSVDASNQHLDETYLKALWQPWRTQDLSAVDPTRAPAVLAGTSPVAIVHSGFTSVYTIDENHDLQETYLSAMGKSWVSHDLTSISQTPQSTTTPTVLVHSGYTSVFTVDDLSTHLQETYLKEIGGSWVTQDLSNIGHTPLVAPGTQPVALAHDGYTSVFTVAQKTDHLEETYLANIGAPWANHDLSILGGTPPTTRTPVALLHPDASGNLTWTSVYTTVQATGHLQETNLARIGEPWTTQDLTNICHTPAIYTTDTPTATWSVIHDGYSSVFTVNATTGGLQETFLNSMGQPWKTQTLSIAPAVRGDAAPMAIVHEGNTSVFTVDSSNGDLQETYLTALGNAWATQDLSAETHTPPVLANVTPTVAVHDGYTSVYTVDYRGDLYETYLSALGQAWQKHNLTAELGIPPVITSPVAVVHDGYTSVYTSDYPSGDLRETYLTAINQTWITQDLTAKYGAPTTFQTPAAVVHDGYVSVFTVDKQTSDLKETYLTAIGNRWITQDLTSRYGAPQGTSRFLAAPVALYHSGYLSVYILNSSNDHLEETFLPAIGDAWLSQDLSTPGLAPPLNHSPSPLLHYDAQGGLTWTSLFSVDESNNHLQETYLPVVGDNWVSKDLSSVPGVPPV